MFRMHGSTNVCSCHDSELGAHYLPELKPLVSLEPETPGILVDRVCVTG